MKTVPHETLKKTPKRLKKVEELFNISQEVLEECQIPEDIPVEVEIVPTENSSTDLVESNEVYLPRIFNLREVREDFVLARRNLYKLMTRCQSLMDGTDKLSIVDMKAGQIDAIANLAKAITLQIQTVTMLYKDMADIETMRTPPELKRSQKVSESEESNEKDSVFVGDSKSLLDIISENS